MKKSTNLSPVEYLKRLEIEWWISNLRRKICPIVKEKQQYRKVSLLKKARIIEISEANDIPHIFSDKEMMTKLNRQFVPTEGGGCPVFEGRSDSDVNFYYYPESDVRCFFGFDENKNPQIKIGKIVKTHLQNKKVEIIFDGETTQLMDFHCVSRIF